MPKILQVVTYRSISDDAKLAAYAELAGPAMKGLPVVSFSPAACPLPCVKKAPKPAPS